MTIINILISIAQFGIDKPGACPLVTDEDKEVECSTGFINAAKCVVDSDCNGTRKCCQAACGFECLQPAQLPKAKEVVGPAGDPGQKGEPVRHSFFLFVDAIMANPCLHIMKCLSCLSLDKYSRAS